MKTQYGNNSGTTRCSLPGNSQTMAPTKDDSSNLTDSSATTKPLP